MDDIQAKLRSVLAEIVAKEKAKLNQIYDDADDEHRQRRQKLQPLFETLQTIKENTSGYEGIDISLAEKGHMALVRLNGGSTSTTLDISTNYSVKLPHKTLPANTKFTVEESNYYSFAPADSGSIRREYENMDDVLRIVMDAIGKHIALMEVVNERFGNK